MPHGSHRGGPCGIMSKIPREAGSGPLAFSLSLHPPPRKCCECRPEQACRSSGVHYSLSGSGLFSGRNKRFESSPTKAGPVRRVGLERGWKKTIDRTLSHGASLDIMGVRAGSGDQCTEALCLPLLCKSTRNQLGLLGKNNSPLELLS